MRTSTRTAAVLLGIAIICGQGAARAEDGPTSLTCEFKEGASWSYDQGKFMSKTPVPLDFDIENIDLEKQTAELKLGNGKNKLSVVRAINANHFIEVVNEGFLNLTTVYDKDPATGNFPAVHSRHFGLLGQPVFAQYTGTCRAK